MSSSTSKKRFLNTSWRHVLLALAVFPTCLILASCSRTIYSHQTNPVNPQRLLSMQELTSSQKVTSSLEHITLLPTESHSTGNEDLPALKDMPISHTIIAFPAKYLRKHATAFRAAFLPEGCDEIILTNGASLKAKVIEISTSEIKYKKCDNLDGPTYSFKKSEVKEVTYANGTTDTFSADQPTTQSGAEKNVDVFSLMGFLFGLLGLILAFVPATIGTVVLLALVGILAIIFGSIGIGRVNHHRDTLMGKGLAIVSLILGIILFIAFIAIISAVGAGLIAL